MMYQGVDDFPIGKWWILNVTGDLSLLLKEKTWLKRISKKQLADRFKLIKEEFFDKIQLNRKLEKYILKQVRLYEIKCDMLILGNTPMGRYWKGQYRLLQLEIQGMDESKVMDKSSNAENTSRLSKYMGYRIDPMVTSMAEYYANVDNMKEEYKRMVAAENKRKALRRRSR